MAALTRPAAALVALATAFLAAPAMGTRTMHAQADADERDLLSARSGAVPMGGAIAGAISARKKIEARQKRNWLKLKDILPEEVKEIPALVAQPPEAWSVQECIGREGFVPKKNYTFDGAETTTTYSGKTRLKTSGQHFWIDPTEWTSDLKFHAGADVGFIKIESVVNGVDCFQRAECCGGRAKLTHVREDSDVGFGKVSKVRIQCLGAVEGEKCRFRNLFQMMTSWKKSGCKEALTCKKTDEWKKTDDDDKVGTCQKDPRYSYNLGDSTFHYLSKDTCSL